MQSVSLPADDLALALELAALADEITLGRFGAADLVVGTKPDMTPVTEADKAVERAVRDRISTDRPGAPVVGEAYGAGPGAGGRRGVPARAGPRLLGSPRVRGLLGLHARRRGERRVRTRPIRLELAPRRPLLDRRGGGGPVPRPSRRTPRRRRRARDQRPG